jgi:hypothetical protein
VINIYSFKEEGRITYQKKLNKAPINYSSQILHSTMHFWCWVVESRLNKKEEKMLTDFSAIFHGTDVNSWENRTSDVKLLACELQVACNWETQVTVNLPFYNLLTWYC